MSDGSFKWIPLVSRSGTGRAVGRQLLKPVGCSRSLFEGRRRMRPLSERESVAGEQRASARGVSGAGHRPRRSLRSGWGERAWPLTISLLICKMGFGMHHLLKSSSPGAQR